MRYTRVQITTVDKATGVIKVSRRALLDAKASVPDTIRPLESETGPSLVSKCPLFSGIFSVCVTGNNEYTLVFV